MKRRTSDADVGKGPQCHVPRCNTSGWSGSSRNARIAETSATSSKASVRRGYRNHRRLVEDHQCLRVRVVAIQRLATEASRGCRNLGSEMPDYVHVGVRPQELQALLSIARVSIRDRYPAKRGPGIRGQPNRNDQRDVSGGRHLSARPSGAPLVSFISDSSQFDSASTLLASLCRRPLPGTGPPPPAIARPAHRPVLELARMPRGGLT